MARYRLPVDVKYTALSYVQGYQRRRAEYKKKYNDIMNSTAANFETFVEHDLDEHGKEVKIECRDYGSRPTGFVGDPTERKALELEMLSRHPDTLRMKAVERARDLIGDHIASDEVREALVKGIFLNCERRQNWTFEKLNLPTISRKEFFEERRRFLYYVAKYSELI